MAEPTGGALFGGGEVLEVSVDTSGFQSGLDALAGIYENWLNTLNSKGIDGNKIISAGSTTQISEVLGKLSTQFDGLQATVAALSETLIEQFSKASGSIEQVTETTKAQADILEETNRQLAEAITNAWVQSNNEIYQSIITRVKGQEEVLKQDAADQELILQQIAQEQGITNEKQLESVRQMVAARIAELNKAANEEQNIAERESAAVARAVAKDTAEYEKQFQQLVAIDQKRDLEQAEMLGKQFAAEEKSAAERVAIQQKRDIEERDLNAKLVDQANSVYEQTAAAATRYYEGLEREAEQANNAQIRLLEQYLEKQNAAFRQSAAAQASYAQQQERNGGQYGAQVVETKPKSEQESIFSSISAESIGKSVVQLAQFQIEMTAINVLFEAALSPAKLFFDTISEGFKFQENLQTRTQDLTGVLLNTVTYSKDFAQNIKLAQQDAGLLVTQIDDLSVKLRVNSDTLKVGFQSFLEAGGANLTKNNDQALQVSGLVTAGLQSLTKNPALLNREEAQEMQKLVEGTVKDGDKLTDIFGLSAEKINEIAKGSQTTKDLFDELIAHSPGLSERLKEAGDNQASLVATLTLYKERFDGLVAGPLFDQVQEILKNLLDYLDQNKEKIAEIATQFGQILADVINIGVEFGKTNWGVISTALKEAVLILIALTRQFVTLGSSIEGLAAASLNVAVGNLTGAYNNLKGIFSDGPLASGLDKLATDVSKLGTDKDDDSTNPKVAGPPRTPRTPINTKPVKTDAVREDRADLASELQKNKEATQEYINEQKQLLASGATDIVSYTDNVIANLELEKKVVKELAAEYAAKVLASGAKGSKATAENITTQGNSQAAAIDKQIAEQRLSLIKDIANAEQIAERSVYSLKITNAKNELDAMKLAGASDLAIAQKTSEIHEQEYRLSLADLNIQKEKGGQSLSYYVNLVKAEDELNAKRSGQKSTDNVAEQLASMHEVLNAYDEQINRNNLLETAQNAASSRRQGQLTNEAVRQREVISNDQKRYDIAEKNYQLALKEVDLVDSTPGATDKQKDDAQKKYDAAKAKLTASDQKLHDDSQTVISVVFDNSSLKDLSDVFKDGFAQGVTNLLGAFATGDKIFKEFEQGVKSGGTLGGIGATLSGDGGKLIGAGADALNQTAASGTGAVSSLLSAAGPFISAIGPAFSLIGSLFTAAAKATADEMKKQFQQIQTNYASGETNLSQTIAAEQATIAQTISSLSGEKGGQGELDSILPGMQQALNSLIQQQKQLEVSMDQNIESLKLNNTYLQSALSTWQTINQQVTSYINAGGSAAEAAQYLSLSLQAQKKQAADDIVAAETSAVQDAQNYNNLLIQRTNLIKQYNEQAFGLKNADSIERKQSVAITSNGALSDLTSNYQQQLQADNQQIEQLGERVSAEQKIFGIATDTASLQKESNDLALYSLQEQVQQWQAMQSVYNGIVQTSSGLYTYTQALANLLGYTATFGNDPGSTYTGTNNPVGTPVTSGSSPALPLLVSGGMQTFNAGAIASQGSGGGTTTIGNITVTINATGGTTIDAASIANSLQQEIINRNQYAASTYYG